MNETVIKFSNVTKIYNIRERGYRSFRDSFSRSLNRILQKTKLSKNQKAILTDTDNEIIYALNNVSFEVNKGEALGIIGANGSGKTTILRLLSNVTVPSSGEISVQGTVAPLIQVGAGFHPELTGRENVYLNATIMGLKKKEIDELYDKIVTFAGLELFMDTPVKRYSSGMYVRLGFAVVANIDPDIFLIDEILSVGDLSFQKKCLDTMASIRKTDKSIVFVSHNLSAVSRLCNRVIWIDKGKIKKEGDSSDVINAYTSYMSSNFHFIQNTAYVEGKPRWGTGEARFTNVELLNSYHEREKNFTVGNQIIVRLAYEAYKKINSPEFAIAISNENGEKIFGTYYNRERAGQYSITGDGLFECVIDTISMRPGAYFVTAGINVELGNISIDVIGRAAAFIINNNKAKGLERYNSCGFPGIVNMSHEWKRIK